MSDHALISFATKVKTNADLRAICASDKCADVDDQCKVTKQHGFDLHPHDFDKYKNGLLVEQADEDFFLKPKWWELVS